VPLGGSTLSKYGSVIIATYKRAHLIKYALDALRKQVYQNFEVLVILCPSNDGTERLLSEYQKYLSIRVLLRKKPLPVTDAWNLGMANSRGDIIAFLDDDAVPEPQWMEQHIQTYNQLDVGGVAGDVIPAVLFNNTVIPSKSSSSEIVPKKPKLEIDPKPWNSPLPGLEEYSIYLTKSGHLHDRLVTTKKSVQKVISAVGANMSFSGKALKTFHFPSDWMPAYACEALLGWHLWRNGHSMIFNPDARVLHIEHGSTLGRSEGRQKALLYTEYQLFFYRLYNYERSLSVICKLLSAAAIAVSLPEISVLRGLFYGNLRGLIWLFSNKVGGSYNPLRRLPSSLYEKL